MRKKLPSEAKQTQQEENIADYAARLEAVLNTVIDGIITINSLGTIRSFNPSAERIFGYTPEEVIGQNVKMLMPDPYHSEHDDYLKNYHETGEKKVIGIGREVEAQRKDGSIFSMELGVSEMKTTGEKMFVGTIRDISDRKKAEENLTEYSARLEAVLNTVIDGIITINSLGTIQSFNPSAERIFGYTPEEVIGQNVKMLMPAPYHGEHDGYLKNYHETGEKKVIGIGREVEAQRKDGSIFSMELGISEMKTTGEKMFVGTIRDISDRKKSEQEVLDSQAKMQAILDNTVDGLITIDDKGCIDTFNKACEMIFGYRAEEVVGQNVKMLMPDPYHTEHDGYLTNYHDTGVKKIIGSGREVEGKRKDGSIFPLDLSVSGVDVKGRKLYSGIVRDITERKKAIEDLYQANAELEEFAYRTSHDLRSPLISSIGLLKVAEKSIEEGKQKRAIETLAYAQKSLKTLEDLVKDILSLTQMKNAEEDEQSIDVSNLIDVTLEKLKHMDSFDRLNIQKTLTFNDALKTKSSRFTLIVENLISNAVKYQDANKEDSFIKVSTHTDGKYFVLEVQDNGLGIPKKQQDKLFTMFKRFHPKTSFGSGLGLYMIKKSADIIKGEIAFEDTGNGSIFKLFVPIK